MHRLHPPARKLLLVGWRGPGPRMKKSERQTYLTHNDQRTSGQNQPASRYYSIFIRLVSIPLRPVIVKAHKHENHWEKSFVPRAKSIPPDYPGETDVPNSTFVIIVFSLHPSGAIV